MLKKIGNVFYAFSCVVLVVQLTGCGTLMYPERKGQRSGRIDVGVAVLDGVGLFFFLIPGIIAYAVDFNNGTIYLPGTARSAEGIKNIKEVKFDRKNGTMARVAGLIQQETGYDVSMYESQMQISKMRSSDEMFARFAETLSEIQNSQVVLLKK